MLRSLCFGLLVSVCVAVAAQAPATPSPAGMTQVTSVEGVTE